MHAKLGGSRVGSSLGQLVLRVGEALCCSDPPLIWPYSDPRIAKSTLPAPTQPRHAGTSTGIAVDVPQLASDHSMQATGEDLDLEAC